MLTVAMVYKEVWSPHVGEELPVQCENTNDHDPFVVAVLKDDTLVSHVPREIHVYKVCWFILQKSGSQMNCQVNSNRRRSVVEEK